MIDYHKGDTLTVSTPDGTKQVFQVMAVQRDDVRPDALTVALQRVQDTPVVGVPTTLAEALTAASVPSVAVAPLAEKLAAYRVHPSPAESPSAVSVEHEPCTWYSTVDGYPEGCSLPHLLALALEHHLTGCKVPR